MKKTVFAMVASTLLLSFPLISSAHVTQSAKAEVLAKSTSSWNGKPYGAYPKGEPELTVMKIIIPANAALPWHTHPYPNAGYVIKGELTIQDKEGHKKTFKAGEGFTESVNNVHRGTTGKEETTLLLVYSGVKDGPTSVSEPGEMKEY